MSAPSAGKPATQGLGRPADGGKSGLPPSGPRRSATVPLLVGLLLAAVVVAIVWWLLVRDTGPEAAPLVPHGEVSLSAVVLDFGDEEVGRRSAAESVIFTNGTRQSIRIEDVGIDGAADDEYDITDGDCLSARLDPGDACTVSVRFTPVGAGGRAARLVFSLDGGPGERTVDLRGAGVGRAAVLIGVTRLDFGERLLDAKPEARELAVTNVGTLPVRITRVAVTGPGADEFVAATKAGCLAARTVEPGSACVVRVAFDPVEPDARVATLFVAHTGEGSPAKVLLRGTGVGVSDPAIAPPTVDLGRVDVGKTGRTRSVTLTNAGSAPLSLGWIAVVGGDSGEFELLAAGTCHAGTPVGAGGSCTAQVRFAPETSGRRASTLVVAGDGRFVQAALRGTGVAPVPAETVQPTIQEQPSSP